MGKLLKAVLIILGVVVVVGGVAVVVVGAGGLIFYNSLPKVTVTNQCADPIFIPDTYRVLPIIPATISAGGTVNVPLLWGAGEYRLYEEAGRVHLGFPRSLPLVGEDIEIAGTPFDPDVTFDGEPLSVPMSWNLESQHKYTLMVCP